MTARQVRRLRARIERPGYYRDRAFQMGELAGDMIVEALFISKPACADVKNRRLAREWHFMNVKANMYRKRAAWYVRKSIEDGFDYYNR